MKPLSYRELLQALMELTPEQLDMSATFIAPDREVYPIMALALAGDLGVDFDDILEYPQPVMYLSVR